MRPTEPGYGEETDSRFGTGRVSVRADPADTPPRRSAGPGGTRKEMSTTTRAGILVGAFFVSLLLRLVVLPQAVREVDGIVLDPHGQAALGVLLFALILWMTEVIPFHITGLLGIVLLTVYRVESFSQIVEYGFGNHIFIFFIGVLILSSFITRSGLGNRISVYLLSRTGNSTAMIIFGFLAVGMLLSMWITNTAVAAMLMPLGVAILREEGVTPMESRFGKALMIACAWGPIVGGIMAPSGAGPNPLAVGFLREMAGINLSFLGWMAYGVPAGLLILVPTWAVLMLFFRPEITHLKKSREELRSAYRELPAMDREERVTTVMFALTVVLWLSTPVWEALLDIAIPISMPVILTAAVFFFPGVAKTPWKTVEREISWDSILLIVTGISLGMVLYHTGAAEWLAMLFLRGAGGLDPLWMVLVVVLVVSFIKVFLSSNTVTATIIIPIMITLSTAVGIDTLSITVPAALTTSMAFILVTSTPTNVIPYSAGYFSISDMALSGTVMTLVAAPIVAAVIYVVGRLTGLY